MDTADDAWLQTANGERLPLRGTCTIGREPGNTIVLTTEKVSRRHALIHAQNETEFWLVDLGSRNGTFRNSTRIKQPTQLRAGDKIDIGPVQFTLGLQQSELSQSKEGTALAQTVVTKRATDVWLLLIDAYDFTVLCQTLAPEELAKQLGAWLLECAELVERSAGSVDKYVGDGFLAYWPLNVAPVDKICSTLRKLNESQERGRLKFRWVLHCAPLHLGTSRFGNESLLGSEINFVFRMEKLAGSLQLPRLISAPAADRLSSQESLSSVGNHSLKGFAQSYLFYTF
jgi:adenylate cyclase